MGIRDIIFLILMSPFIVISVMICINAFKELIKALKGED